MRHDCTRPTTEFPGKTWPDFLERAARVGCRQQKNLRSGIAGGSESSGNLRPRCCLSPAHALEGSPGACEKHLIQLLNGLQLERGFVAEQTAKSRRIGALCERHDEEWLLRQVRQADHHIEILAACLGEIGQPLT